MITDKVFLDFKIVGRTKVSAAAPRQTVCVIMIDDRSAQLRRQRQRSVVRSAALCHFLRPTVHAENQGASRVLAGA